ncbi:hypothetical protein GGX14DRAFT_396050 [Mycena pura]|uniref:Uncharacterized protein n=1 Tax=Mycena pura TaxID=153505 RepID=A0AAD6VI42_9AGAR|nr:hypothetical protein GGX14DRAFT_396050 [Mycena pura]
MQCCNIRQFLVFILTLASTSLRMLNKLESVQGLAQTRTTVTSFPEGEVSGFARDSMGLKLILESRGFEYFQQPPNEPISVDENDYIAPRDINLNLDAADVDSVAAVRPAKRGQWWTIWVMEFNVRA